MFADCVNNTCHFVSLSESELITRFTSKTQLQGGSSQESGLSTDLQMVLVCSSFSRGG